MEKIYQNTFWVLKNFMIREISYIFNFLSISFFSSSDFLFEITEIKRIPCPEGMDCGGAFENHSKAHCDFSKSKRCLEQVKLTSEAI